MKKFVRLALILGGIAAASRIAASKKAEWTGLTEAQVRAKMASRLPSEMPDDRREKVIDRVGAGLRDRGMLSEESVSDQSSETMA